MYCTPISTLPVVYLFTKHQSTGKRSQVPPPKYFKYKMSKDLKFSFVAGELISPGSDLEIRTSRPVDRKAARSAVVLQKDGRILAIAVTIDSTDTIIRVSTKNLGTGRFRLHLHELLDANGKELVKYIMVPFALIALTGKVPGDRRVEHATRVALGEVTFIRLTMREQPQPNVKYIEFVKAVSRESGEPVDLAFNEKGEEVDGHSALADVQNRRYNKFGKLHETLFGHLKAANDDDDINVVVWPNLKVDLTSYEKPTTGEIKEPLPEALKLLEEAIVSRTAAVDKLKELGATVRETPAEIPLIYASLSASQARKLAKVEIVGNVFLDDKTGIPDLADSLAVARAPQAQALGYTGTGVSVAVFEAGPSNLNNLAFAGRFSTMPLASWHARLTSAIIKNVEPEKPHGYAPDCNLYSANSFDNAALQWAVHSPQHCTVISQSFHRIPSEGQNEQGSPFLSNDDILKDHMATSFPYPTILHAAGNGPDIEYVNHKGFNTLSVGSHDDNATSLGGDSVFRNPASHHCDRELPELVANGIGVRAVGEWGSGTSFAAPAVAGTAALIQSVDDTLKSWPEGCRAILLASADRNICGGTWPEDVVMGNDQHDGSGALNAQLAVLIAQQRRHRDAPASLRGWDVGQLVPANFDHRGLARFNYYVDVHSPAIPAPHTYAVKVAVAWQSKLVPDANGVLSSILTVDHDLIVEDSTGFPIASSTTYDNSYEIVEFFSTASETYKIRIRRWSGGDSVWFGIAWNVITSKRLTTSPLIAPVE